MSVTKQGRNNLGPQKITFKHFGGLALGWTYPPISTQVVYFILGR